MVLNDNRFKVGALLVAGVLAAPVVWHARDATAQAAGKAQISSSGQRTEVGITVYNDGFGLVREVRDIPLGTGRIALEFRDVSAQIQPETVAIKPLGGGATLKVFEQNYRYDLLSPAKLLEKYVGKKVRVYRWNEKLGKEDGFDAEVLSVNGGQSVLKINGEITYDFPGRIAFPEVPANLIAKPTLVWLLDSTAAKQKVEVTYLTRGLGWKADYVFALNDKDDLGDLQGWVTLTNNTGASYENAKLKLVAGNVQKIATYDGSYPMGNVAISGKTAAKEPPKFNEEGFFEYHLYTLSQPTTVMDREQKQVTLLEGKDVKVQKKLIFFGSSYFYRSKYGQVTNNQKVGVYLDIENKEANHLGIALPKGTVRVYKADKSGAKQFIGEDMIDHTPRDEKVRIKMGEAFDVVADKKQMDWKPFGSCVSESAWEIKIKNHKDVVEEVELVEPVGGDWEILSSTLPATKKDQWTFTFNPKIPAKGEVTVKYRVRIRWC
jgi:hypothetical protein